MDEMCAGVDIEASEPPSSETSSPALPQHHTAGADGTGSLTVVRAAYLRTR